MLFEYAQEKFKHVMGESKLQMGSLLFLSPLFSLLKITKDRQGPDRSPEQRQHIAS